MISVIIPALNEASTIQAVVRLCMDSALVSEVIVVDDKSIDDTVILAKEAGARVITSTKLGKGTSMRDGMMTARNEVLVFLDADITTYPEDIVARLGQPILDDRCDFTKSYFSRQAGRVTELVAKPLLSIMYPNFPSFIQPLSGMIGGRRSMFERLRFEDGYGVDLGILIDMYKMGARILEVELGHIENKMQPLEQLGRMSREVATVILEKADRAGTKNLETFEHIQVIREQMEFAIREKTNRLEKLAIIDMDRTLIESSFINTCAKKFGFEAELIDIVTSQTNPFIRTKQIAQLLKGKTVNDLLDVAESIPISKNAELLIRTLREKGYRIGIISDSYEYVTNYYMNRLGIDFSLANELEFSRSMVTGEVKIPSFFLPNSKSVCTHEICKTHAILNLCESLQIDPSNTLTIGDGENDICMTKKSGIGIAFCASAPMLNLVADFVISERDMSLIAALL
jgi:glucosyl-3-phosphoglycerate synthase